MKTERPEPKLGEVWRDRDKRMFSGNRRVKVTLVAFGHVTYRQVVGANNCETTRLFRSETDRFRRAFEPVGEQ